MEKVLKKFEKIISWILLVAGMMIVSIQVMELIWETFNGVYLRFKEVGLQFAPEYLKSGVLLFFNILLTLEVLQTVKAYKEEHIVKIKVILLICLIAVSRKILLLDVQHGNPKEEYAVAVLIIALALGYYLIDRQAKNQFEKDNNIEKDFNS